MCDEFHNLEAICRFFNCTKQSNSYTLYCKKDGVALYEWSPSLWNTAFIT